MLESILHDARNAARSLVRQPGTAALALAFHSPLVALQRELLIGRAGQQILIGLLAPPLLWLACPAHVILRGLPAPARRWIAGRLKKSTWSGLLVRRLTHPLIVWLLAFSVFLLWHEPGIAFLYGIIGGEVPNMVTGVTLAFRNTPAYSYYADRLPVSELTTIQDQMVSGGIIWFLGSIIYVGVAVGLLGRVFRNFEAPRPQPITWEATERTIAPGLEHRVLGP